MKPVISHARTEELAQTIWLFLADVPISLGFIP